ncbi:hypothetical protein BROC_00026 [Candidatus Brocadiaceae bacterium]|nr:hypothetical protein BROC_00026 [Candidatus Brocadiaceae bacterium]
MRNVLLMLLLVTSLFQVSAQICKEEDRTILEKKFSWLRTAKTGSLPIGDAIAAIGKSFIGTGYEAFTLETGDDTQPLIMLTGLDCTTFLETSVALALTAKKGEINFDEYAANLEKIRYRNGSADGYLSRLHYFTDWIADNSARGIITDVTRDLGGIPYQMHVSFMSSNPDKYARMTSSALVDSMKKIEARINKRSYSYIPKDKVAGIEESIRNGDLIAITSSIKGLDIVHVGIAVVGKNNDRVYFMHAPQPETDVQITKLPLSDYLKNNKKQTGIMVLRVN